MYEKLKQSHLIDHKILTPILAYCCSYIDTNLSDLYTPLLPDVQGELLEPVDNLEALLFTGKRKLNLYNVKQKIKKENR